MGNQPWVCPAPWGGGEHLKFFFGEDILNGFLGVPDPKYEIKFFLKIITPPKKIFFWGGHLKWVFEGA